MFGSSSSGCISFRAADGGNLCNEITIWGENTKEIKKYPPYWNIFVV
jgi:hypothetical protein